MTTRKKTMHTAPRSLRRMFPNLKHVVDADEAIDINVQPGDCKAAKRKDPKNCALAKAAKREFHADAAVIGLSSSYIIKGDKAVRFATPESVQREIVSFDRHADFEPGSYHLSPKAPAARFGVSHRSKNKTGGKNKSATRRVVRSARVRMFSD